MSVRVRYAPSPTGAPHVGNIRTALFTWLLARHSGGQFIVRIEDTDRTRFLPGSYQAILDSLRWLGLDWDEGPDRGGPYAPYVQSERLPHYHEAVEKLIAQGDAYRCFCTVERLEEMRQAQVRANRPTGYDRRCRTLDRAEVAARLAAGEPHVVRFAMPTTGKLTVHDLIRGPVTFDLAKLDDHVILKSDGMPTYHLAATLDDELMKITHVIRGDEWISSLPRHIQFHKAMGVEPPLYAHPPLIIGPDRKKLSKRNGDAALADYRTAGYLPEAMFNFLGTLGWSLDDKTSIISREQFVEHFTLDRIGASPAMWDMKRLDWMNGEYLRETDDDHLLGQVAAVLDAGLPEQVARPVDRELIAGALPLLKTRLKKLSEAVQYTEYLFPEVPLAYEPELLLGKKFHDNPATAGRVLALAGERFAALTEWDHAVLEAAARAAAAEIGVKDGDFFGPIRIAITGRTVSLPLFETMELLGRDVSLARIAAAGERLATGVGATP
jgi:glutamyl-tRNA synthetase